MFKCKAVLHVLGLLLLISAFLACSEDTQPAEDTGKKPVDTELDLTGDETPTDGKDNPPDDTPTDTEDTETELVDTAAEDTDTTPEGEACPLDMLDPFTGLCWFTIIDTDSKWGWPVSATFDEAVTLCDELEQDGWDDWRLPTIDEHRANVIPECENTTIGGACDIRIDCDYYSFLDECTEFTGSIDDRKNCGHCGWSYTPDCKWHIELNTNCATGYWSSDQIQGLTDTAYYLMNYSNGNIWRSWSFGNFVACVREAQDMDEDEARLPAVRPVEGNGCDEDGTTAMCSYLKGADFGSQEPSSDPNVMTGWYFDGESCVSTQYNITEFCLYDSDVECAKACAANGECNPKRLDRDMLSLWNKADKFVGGGTESMAGGWVCADLTKTTVLDDMYPDDLTWRERSACPEGDWRANLINVPNAVPPEPYADIDITEWQQICGYSLLTWVSYVTGLKYF